jgi:signal transduction histidine kinase
VAGVAHEINTPLGVAVTAASLVADRLHEVETAFTAGTLRRQDLQHGLAQAQEAARMTLGNLRRAAGMVGNFKQIAVDQQSEARREVSLGPYVREVIASLGPLYRRTPHRVSVNVLQDAVVTTFVGAISQVMHQPGPERAGARLPRRAPRGPDHARPWIATATAGHC